MSTASQCRTERDIGSRHSVRPTPDSEDRKAAGAAATVGTMDADELFAPPAGDVATGGATGADPAPTSVWRRVDHESLATARRLVMLPWVLVAALGCALPAMLVPGNGWARIVLGSLAVGLLALAGWLWHWAGRNARSWGYLETDDDLLVTGGVMFRRLVAVPYGRMQYVDVEAGPLDRSFGIATVTLHTASTRTAATIPGLPSGEATRLRNRLTELGETHGAGL